MDIEKDFEDGYESTSFGRIHYKCHSGPNQKIIFLHGVGGSIRVWKRLMGYMPEELDITLLDLLGHGSSDAPDIDYTIRVQAETLKEFIDLRNEKYAYIFGHSYGGWIAAYYSSMGYVCRGLILEDAIGLKDYFDDASTNEQESKENIVKEMLKNSSSKESVIRSIVNNGFILDDQLDSKALSKIDVPTLIIWGADDTTVSRRFADVFDKGIKNSSKIIVEGAGHLPHYTYPKEVALAVNDFVHHI